MLDNANELIKKGEEMAGRKKKSAEKQPLFTQQEQEDMLCELIGSIVGDKGITGFILIAESETKDHIAVRNMNTVTCLGYAEKLSLMLRNKILIQMVKADETDKSKKRRNKKTSNN